MDPLNGNTGSASDDSEDVTAILRPVELTERDVAIFKMIHEHRYLAYGQMRAAFWKDRSEPANRAFD